MKIKIGADFGASRVKIAFKNKEGKLVKKTFANRYLEGSSNSSSGYLVERNSEIVRIAGTKGKSNRVDVKLNYQHLEEILLVIGYLIREEFKQGDKYVSLALETLLPPRQFQSIEEEFKAKLKAFGTIKGKVEGFELEVIIDNVSANCEGVALLDALDMDEFAGNVDRVFLVDAGSSTVDWVDFEREDGEWGIVDADTLMEVGGATIISAIAGSLEKEYPGEKFDADVLEKKMTYLVGDKQFNVIDVVDYADKVVTAMKPELERAYKGGKVVVTGGAAELLMANSRFKEIFPTAILVEEDIRSFGNAVGALYS